MGEDKKKATSEGVGLRGDPTARTVVENHERWVAGKTEQELLADLKTHLALLKDNPRSIPDRLRVAAIQLRLGRIDEALIHYEGVVGGYVAQDQVMSAVHLCERLLAMYPKLGRVKQLLAALYARVPRKARSSTGLQKVPSQAVEPIPSAPIKEVPSSSFKLNELNGLGEPARAKDGTDRFVLVDRLFPDSEDPPQQKRRASLFDSQVAVPVQDEPPEAEDRPMDPEDKTTEKLPFKPLDKLVLLTRLKDEASAEGLDDDTEQDTEQDTDQDMAGIEVEEVSGDSQRDVVLLDTPKKKD